MKYDEALRLAKVNPENDNCMIWWCASNLRNDIFAAQSKKICEPVAVGNIMESEAIPPDSVKRFFKLLYTGNV